MSVHISNDPRALAREAVALAAQGGAAAGKPARGHGKGTFVLGVLNVTADQLTSSAAAIVEGAKAATADLTQRLPAVMAQPMPFRDVKPGTADFATGMAGVQQSYGPQLGHLSTDPQTITQGVAVAAAADAIIAPLETYLTILYNIRGYSLSSANKEAGVIYRRAKSVAETFPAVGKAIARFADALSRVAKKAQATRKHKAKAAAANAAAVPAQAEPVKTTSTTVTTQQ